MAVRMWCLIQPNSGRILRTRLTDDPCPGPGWIECSQEMLHGVRADSNRYKYRDGCVEAKKKVRLSVSTPVFEADGEDKAEVMVIPHEEGTKGSVTLRINGEETEVAFGEVLEIRSDEEGSFTIEVDDLNFVAVENRRGLERSQGSRQTHARRTSEQ